MKKIAKNFVIGGIQQKVFNLVLVAILLVVGAYTAVLFYQSFRITTLVSETNERQKQTLTETTESVMNDRLTANLGQSTQMEAYIADDLFESLAGSVRMMQDYAQKLFNDPEGYSLRGVSFPDPSKDGEVSVQMLAAAEADLGDPQVAEELALAANMTDLLAALFDNTHINSSYVALPSGVMLLADDHPSTKFDSNGDLIPIPIRERPWYTGAVTARDLVFTDVVRDVFTGEIGIMCAAPVYRGEELAAVVGADLFLDSMAQAVDASDDGGDGFVCIINEQGHVIFSPRTEGVFQVKPANEAADLRRSDDTALAALLGDAFHTLTEPVLVTVDGSGYYMCGAPIGTVGWVLVNAVSQKTADRVAAQMNDQYDSILNTAYDTFYRNLSHSRTTILVLLLVASVLALSCALILAKRIVNPLETITTRIQNLGGKNLQFVMEDAYRTGDEIEVLADSFAKLSAKTLRYVDEVTRITAEKERIGAELNMATAIQASQLPQLFPPFPNRKEFDLYATMDPAKEVGGDFYDFFLVDNDHIALVMADVSGKGVPAALFMMVSRVLIKTHLQNGESPAEALCNVNELLCESNDAGFFVTVWAAVLEISTGKGIAVNAGHEHPAIHRANEEFALVTYRHSPAVATMEGLKFREHSFMLHPGDSFFVYTDGVAEAANAENELFGTERMLDALNEDPDADPQTILKNVREGIDGFVSGAEQFDDITMLCLKYYGPKKPE